jgi:outer membrane PBP1 activator LpoA protein
VLAAFREELTAGGGSLLAAARFDPLATSYEPAITDVLRIDESAARFKRVESIVGGKLEFQPRRRADIDFIFAPSSAATARLLTPQLKYFFAGNLPTYATSEAYQPNPTADEDLEGLMFPIMPWLLGSGLADSVRLAASSAWPAGGPPRDRLFAFGFDAYRLMMALRSAPASTGGQARNVGAISLEGLTGELTIDSSGRVHRGLDWAQVHNGQPRPLPPPSGEQTPAAPAPSPPAPAPSPAAAPPGTGHG